MISNLVSAAWLYENLKNPEVIVLDASLANPIEPDSAQCGAIPNSIFFDLDSAFSDNASDLPHMMVSEEVFNHEASKLGIGSKDTIIVYDSKGIYSSPRVWYMFKSMGFENVFVLDGGLPEWTKMGFETLANHRIPQKNGNFTAKAQAGFFVSRPEVETAIARKSASIIDARHPNRFKGLEGEPRKGLKRGHIPSSVNIYFGEVLEANRMKPAQELKTVFKKFSLNDQLIFSCGSGVTACIAALAAIEAGYANVAVYDGSWSEWGRQ